MHSKYVTTLYFVNIQNKSQVGPYLVSYVMTCISDKVNTNSSGSMFVNAEAKTSRALQRFEQNN